MDGDGRGGAALSMRAVTGKPIRFVGLGEKMDALETFEAERVAGRILGMGDIVALVEKARETFEAEQAERMAKRFAKGLFNMNDMRSQLEQMMKMGGMQGLMGMLPGHGWRRQEGRGGGLQRQDADPSDRADQFDDEEGTRQPRSAGGQPQQRIAAGAGLDVADLNKLLKQHKQMAEMMKKMCGGWYDEAGHQADAGQGRDARPVADVARSSGRSGQGHETGACRWAAASPVCRAA